MTAIARHKELLELRRKVAALDRRLDQILIDPKYVGGVQYWIQRHDALLARWQKQQRVDCRPTRIELRPDGTWRTL